jgi:hypothetical protein
MATQENLSTSELAALEQVAEGMSAHVPAELAERLIHAGLATRIQEPGRPGPTLELSPEELRQIRSSDQ